VSDRGVRSELAVGIPVRNQLPFVEACLASLRRHSPRVPVLIVDDASEAPCAEFLAEQAASHPGTDLVRNDRQRGFPYNCNEILYNTSAATVCLLNSDTLVAPGWDQYVLEAMARSAEYALAGPSTCFTHTGQQLTELLASRLDQDLAGVERIGAVVRECFRGQTRVLPTLGGFCLFLRRELVHRVGYFDERFGLGCGEEDDFAYRAIRAGFKPVWVQGAYVHHFGHCSFTAELGTRSRDLWVRNRALLELKQVALLGEVVHAPPPGVQGGT
jgi:GT2 family glycosyltransferase